MDWMAIESLSLLDLLNEVRVDKRLYEYYSLPVKGGDYWIMVVYMPLALGEGYDVLIDGKYATTVVLNL